jgi:ferrous iron transport protein A
METEQEQVTTLSDIENGRRVRLVTIDGGHAVNRRLAAMGMLPNTELEVISNGHPGPFIVRVRGTRIALGRGVARKIVVR